MIDLYFWPTVNCHETSIFPEECGAPLHPGAERYYSEKGVST